MASLLARLEARKRREHRIEPSIPITTAADAVPFIRAAGVVMASGRSSLPTLTEAIVGRAILGSWMADPEVHRIYDLWTEIDRSEAITSAPLVQGKQVYLRADLAPALHAVMGDAHRRAQAIEALKPLERELYDAVIANGELRVDDWSQTNLLSTSRVRTARTKLAALFLVSGRELHTEAGHHTVVLSPFSPPPSEVETPKAMGDLLLTALTACVIADDKEVRRWNDWSASAVDGLLADGSIVAVDDQWIAATAVAESI